MIEIKGTPIQSPDAILKAINLVLDEDKTVKEAAQITGVKKNRVLTYINMRRCEDTRCQANRCRAAKVRGKYLTCTALDVAMDKKCKFYKTDVDYTSEYIKTNKMTESKLRSLGYSKGT